MKLVQLKDVATVFNGKTPSVAEQRNAGKPVLKIKNVNEFGLFKGQFESFVDEDFYRKFCNKAILPGDTLILNAAHNADYVGSKQYYAENVVEGAIATGEWAVVRANRGILDSSYLRHVLQSPEIRHNIKLIVKGIHLYPKDLEQIEIPLPPLSEQMRLSAILDKADSIRRKRQEAVRLTEELLRSVFLDMFGDPVTNPKGWDSCRLGAVVEEIESGWSPVCEERQANENEWGVLKLGAVTSCRYLDSENKALPVGTTPRADLEVKAGDLLFTRKNTYDLVAASALVYSTQPKLMLSDLIFRLRLKCDAAVTPEYLWALLTNPGKRKQIQSLAGGSSGSMPNISKAKLMEQMIEVPPMALQEKYSKILHSNYSIRNNLEATALTSNALFNSLLQKAFNGDLVGSNLRTDLKYGDL